MNFWKNNENDFLSTSHLFVWVDSMLSGGPIYFTDEPEKIKKDIIDMLYTDGKILRMRRNLRPTYDVMYKLNDSPIKCFNDFNHKYAFLSIGVNPEEIQKTTFQLTGLHLTEESI